MLISQKFLFDARFKRNFSAAVLLQVLSSTSTKQRGQRAKVTIILELQDFLKGTKQVKKVGPSDVMEVADVEKLGIKVTGVEGDTVVGETFDKSEKEFPISLFAPLQAYVTKGINVTVTFNEDDALVGSLPDKAYCVVKQLKLRTKEGVAPLELPTFFFSP